MTGKRTTASLGGHFGHRSREPFFRAQGHRVTGIGPEGWISTGEGLTRRSFMVAGPRFEKNRRRLGGNL